MRNKLGDAKSEPGRKSEIPMTQEWRSTTVTGTLRVLSAGSGTRNTPTSMLLSLLVSVLTGYAFAGQHPTSENQRGQVVRPAKPAQRLEGRDDRPAAEDPGQARDREAAGEDIQPGNKEHPFMSLGRRMRQVERRIAGGDSSPQTQQLQRQILADLRAIVERSRQQQRQQNASQTKSSGQSPTAGQPGQSAGQGPQKSTDRLGKGNAKNADLGQLRRKLYRVWGHWPTRIQQQMVSATTDGFLPKYRELIQQYYKRLAEELPDSP